MDEETKALRREMDALRDFTTMLVAALLSKGILSERELNDFAKTYVASRIDQGHAEELRSTFSPLLEEAAVWLSGQDLPQPPS